MSIQNLEIWASEEVIDGETEIAQRRDIQSEEFLNGWKRLGTVSAQQMNGILYLLSSYSPPYAHCAYQIPSSVVTPSIALDLDGSTFTEEDYPELYAIYSGTLPDLSSEAVTGFKWVIRAV